MEDKFGSLGRLRAMIAEAEKAGAQSIKVGDIIYIPLDEEDGLTLKDGYKTRLKFVVIIGFTPDGIAIGALLVNSGIDLSKRSAELINCQYPLLHRNYPGILDYDCWLDCSDILELPKLKISDKGGRLKGNLIAEDLERVMQFLKETDLFDTATKRYYGITEYDCNGKDGE